MCGKHLASNFRGKNLLAGSWRAFLFPPKTMAHVARCAGVNRGGYSILGCLPGPGDGSYHHIVTCSLSALTKMVWNKKIGWVSYGFLNVLGNVASSF